MSDSESNGFIPSMRYDDYANGGFEDFGGFGR